MGWAGDGEGDPPPEPEPPGEVDPPEPPAWSNHRRSSRWFRSNPTPRRVALDRGSSPSPTCSAGRALARLSFCCANGSRAVPVEVSSARWRWRRSPPAGPSGCGAVLDGNGICASALLPGDLERKTGIATSAARRATATGHSRFSRSSLMMSLKKLISPRRSRRRVGAGVDPAGVETDCVDELPDGPDGEAPLTRPWAGGTRIRRGRDLGLDLREVRPCLPRGLSR